MLNNKIFISEVLYHISGDLSINLYPGLCAPCVLSNIRKIKIKTGKVTAGQLRYCRLASIFVFLILDYYALFSMDLIKILITAVFRICLLLTLFIKIIT
jgi:hypothetical protein